MSNDYFFKTPRFCIDCENLLMFKSIEFNFLKFECRFCSKLHNFELPNIPLSKKTIKNNENFDPSILKTFKNDPTLTLSQINCPKCSYPQSKSVACTQSSNGKLLMYNFCERKEPKCNHSWM